VITLQDKKGLYPSDPGKAPQEVTVVVCQADVCSTELLRPINGSGLFFWGGGGGFLFIFGKIREGRQKKSIGTQQREEMTN